VVYLKFRAKITKKNETTTLTTSITRLGFEKLPPEYSPEVYCNTSLFRK
jgi:hypothetical protein